MSKLLNLTATAAALAMLAGCVETPGPARMPAAPAGNAPEEAGRAACLRDVRAVTANPEAVVLGSSFSEAGTEVIIGVGPTQARWRCIAYRDGTTADIMSLTDEGYL
ncbi:MULTISPECIES: hypothetical protein [Roseicyclus]|jgi:hypothetical protein|uniref:Lipoprotein n=1 Tax=Roseicyclus marinus TaxID=2161673 RepID=A0AA48KM59_9RHOB|nr:hypothetical protein MACH21_30270 [Roseicyclus marinus]